MLMEHVEEIKNLAHNIDVRINLFEGYSPKKLDGYKGEIRFWREIVSIYGLYADCDRVQIKEKNNLFELLVKYSLIDDAEYKTIRRFWDDVSILRKWFCHNNDLNLHFNSERNKRLTRYLNNTFLCNTDKPGSIEEIKDKDWELMCYIMGTSYSEYIRILQKGLQAWQESSDKSEMVDQWINIFSNALFGDRELINNVLADIALYDITNKGITNISVADLSNAYYNKILSVGFSKKYIEDELKNEPLKIRTNKEIVYQSICNSKLI